ncbi:hypothetical protein PTSG_08991 [Salpingoeca rosetta]|uniref:Bifunctional lysine-specific demethylase and histidyl-hydroxylase n=1 Tax=Salpingoeca rosetta (strain ATCC 50818 / BSB-021) TaxID=946362 RepID=F2ULW4_SALR5|nr:uncharacterized protein PTSG_08991 [Salpingoeca rosetta]EGD78113.1 hypothetical protein PTSG_08991 [Salpingoeca rosetta]|eukprot:XP_004989789.1 hypothetical protein PTSG_08991 [Salpingoeca rosetta]
MEDELAAGAGLLIRYEDLVDSPAQDHVKQLQDGVRDVFGTESTVHLYHATQNESRALMPHTDPYDVLVIQLHGSKRWTTCIPDAYVSDTDTNNDGSGTNAEDDDNANTGTGDHGASASASASSSSFPSRHGTRARPSEAETIKHFNPAQLGQLQEIRRQRQQGCTAYQDADLRGMRCNEFTLRAGDTMYMPKGIIHFALSGEEGSWRRADEAKAFLASFQSLCREVGPDTYTKANDLDAFLNADGIGALVERVCSEESAAAVVEQLCARGKMPVDVTSPRFRKMHVPQMERVRRSTRTTAYTCDSSCDSSCDTRSCNNGCDSSCDSSCNSGCTSCDSSCDVCDSSCDSSCDSTHCDGSCDSSCDACDGSCDSSCDICDSSCDSGCNAGCDSSCDICDYGCDYSCDAGCDSGCDSSCDSYCGSCDSSCDGSCDFFGWSCDSYCDSSCDSSRCNRGCDSSCDSSCSPVSCDSSCDSSCNGGCDSSCDGPCNSNCDGSCDASCDSCTYSSCDSSCDGSCSCNPGYYGSGTSCTACGPNTYSASSGQSSCTPCGSCGSNQYRVNCGGSNDGSCTSCGSCPAGSERTGCSGTSAGTCSPCDSGTYKTSQDNQPCSPCGSCAAGYYRAGCGGSSAGECVGVQCNTPPSVSHGSVSSLSNNGQYPSTATYTCAPGYMLASSSDNKLQCQTDKTWAGTMPRCIGVPCPGISIAHGSVSPSGTIRHPSTAGFSCNTGYVLMGATSAQCQADGTWSSPAPTCVGRLCTLLDTPNHGSVSYTNSRQYPSTATYTCQAGYELSDTGDAQRSCIASTGGFGGTAPSCVGVLCKPLSDPQNGHLRLSSTPARYPATAEFSCAR